MKKCLLIYNPKAGREIFINEMSKVIENLSVKYEVTVIPTTHKGHIGEIIPKRHKDFDLIVVCGGDGSVSEAMESMTKNKIKKKLAVIPCGSTNDFSKNLYKCDKLSNIAKVIANDKTMSVDVFEINGKAITYVAGFGLFTDLSYSTSQELKNIFGYGGYVLNAVSKFSDINLKKVQLNYVDQYGKRKKLDENVFVCLFSNSKQIAGMENPSSKNVKLNDGIMECIMIKSFHNNIGVDDLVKVVKMKKCEVALEEKVKWTIDGEFGGEFSKASIKLRSSINVVKE